MIQLHQEGGIVLTHLQIDHSCLKYIHLSYDELAPVCKQCDVSLTILHIL
jgi:hypothetical protein